MSAMSSWPLPVTVHVASVLGALVIGAALLGRRMKGDRAHRIAGWSWVALMLVAAISTLWIPGFLRLSWIHVFTVITLVSVPQAVGHARAHRVTAHAQAMKGVFLYGLVLAGLFAFLPGRRLGNMVLALF
jgi:uncharacterized membrane protein